jgi:RHS repeat-associated protein
MAIDYEALADGITAQKRPLAHVRSLFFDNAMHISPLGQWDSLALPHRSYQLAFTPSVAAAHFAGRVSDAEFVAAGYVHFDGDLNWWIPSGTAIFGIDPRSNFYRPVGAADALGIETLATVDKHLLLIERVEVRQAAWNVVTAINDYRVLGPVLTTDPNGNRSAVAHDVLGQVVRTAIMGKVGSADGDTLADPTTRLEYEIFNWMNNRKPNFVHTFAREQHGAANPRWQESYAYSDGGGGVVMIKAQAHPGKAFEVRPDGTKVEVDADDRWVGNGRTVLNNKGKPVKQYEPFFSITFEYEDERVVREIGVTSIQYYDPVGRKIRTAYPNGTFAKSEFNPWSKRDFDVNDTVKQSRWYTDRGGPDPAEPEPLNNPERRSAWLAAKHADTPSVVYADSLGRPIYAVSDYGGGKASAVRSETDLTGRLCRLFDQEQREVASSFVGMAGTPVAGDSAEKGRRWTFQNALGALIKTWDEHGRQFRTDYDGLHRPVSAFVKEGAQPEILFSYIVYGDRLAGAGQLNLLGSAHQIFDQAGMVRIPELDFKGNPKVVERVLAKDYKNALDWNALPLQGDVAAVQAAANPALEADEVFAASSQYDALNRPTMVTLPDGTVILPAYNEANFLKSLRAQIRGDGPVVDFLKGQDYDAKGQRQVAHYGNDVFSRYFYDPDTFRLTSLVTVASGEDSQTESLQNLAYSYDPVGNITQIRDDAQQTHFFNNAVVKPESSYEFDAIYQLVRATGRELAGHTNGSLRTDRDLEVVQLPHANDVDAVRNYTEEYEYDLLGNIKLLKHRFHTQPGIGGGWTRRYQYAFDDTPGNRTNRLTATSLPGDAEVGPLTGMYNYDAYGNMTRMPHLANMDWNFGDQLRSVDLGGGGTAHYVYDSGGQRIRKVIERNGNVTLEWIFLGSVTVIRRRQSKTNSLRMERWIVDINDATSRIAQVDTKTLDEDGIDPSASLLASYTRYQFSNHTGSTSLETDEGGNPLSYEEYHPYGTSAYRSSKSGLGSSNRHRFGASEVDDETGFGYFGTRYYAPWLSRWTSSDVAGLVDGPNLFRFCRNSPVMFTDVGGTDPVTVVEKRHFTGKESYEDLRGLTVPKGYEWDADVTSGNYSTRWHPGAEKGGEGGVWEVLKPARGTESPPTSSAPVSTEQVASAAGTVASTAQAVTEGAIWNPTISGTLSKAEQLAINSRRGFILDALAGNNLGRNFPLIDKITTQAAVQIKSVATESARYITQVARSATRDAAKAIAKDSTLAGRAAQAEIIVPTGTSSEIVNAAEGALQGIRKPILGAVGPKVVRGLPGVFGAIGKALAFIGAPLAAYSFYKDLSSGHFADAILGDATGFISAGLTIGALAIGSATLATGAAVVGAFSLGYALGSALDKGVAWATKKLFGADLSPSNVLATGLSALDEALTSLWMDPSKPAYSQTIGWKIANLLD